jgi:hypothetical protein
MQPSDVTRAGEGGYRAMHWAARANSVQCLQWLHDHGGEKIFTPQVYWTHHFDDTMKSDRF